MCSELQIRIFGFIIAKIKKIKNKKQKKTKKTTRIRAFQNLFLKRISIFHFYFNSIFKKNSDRWIINPMIRFFLNKKLVSGYRDLYMFFTNTDICIRMNTESVSDFQI